MGNNPLSIRAVHLSLTDSTNRYIRDHISELRAMAPGTDIWIVSADSQTAGRGQRGNVWLAEEGKNLLMSMAFMADFLHIKEQFYLSEAVALAVKRMLHLWGIEISLKWPNDIYYQHSKLAGILVEVDCSGNTLQQAIVGIGLNVNQDSFEAMDRHPISLKNISGRVWDCASVMECLMENFSHYFLLLKRGSFDEIASEYCSSLMGWREAREYADAKGHFFASIEGVEADGHLRLLDNNGEPRRYAFKEVEMVI